MRAAVFHRAGDVRIETRSVPRPGPGEVLLQVDSVGICGSDAHEFASGPHSLPRRSDGSTVPTILGHEFTGTVVASGIGATTLPIGARVVSGAGVSCGQCRSCRRGRTNLCIAYYTLGLQKDGGLAQYVVAPESILHDVSESGLASDTLAMAQPMAIAVHAVRRSRLKSGDDAVVIGVGGIGAFLCFAAAQVGARVLAIDMSLDRLKLAEQLGAVATQATTEKSIDKLPDGAGFDPDVVFEASGSAAGMRTAIEVMRAGAVLVPVGIQPEPISIDIGKWSLTEVSMVGTLAHVFALDIPDAVALLARRESWADIARVVLPLDTAVDGGLRPLAAGASPQVKILIDPWAESARPAVHGQMRT